MELCLYLYNLYTVLCCGLLLSVLDFVDAWLIIISQRLYAPFGMRVSSTDKCHLRPFRTHCAVTAFCSMAQTHSLVIHSPLTQKTSIKGCLLVFTLFIYGLSPLRSRLFFRPSSYNQGDLIHFSSRCSGDKVPVYHIYLQLSMFNAQYNWNQMVYCCS